MYDRELDGRELVFGVSGKLYRNSLIMFDRETGTLWSHLLGVAVQGPLARRRLRVIPSTVAEWRGWRRAHPRTLVLSPADAPYGEDAYAAYYASAATGILGTRRRDTRLPPKSLVLGVLAPAAKAYPFRDLEARRVIHDRLAGRPIEVVYDRRARSADAFEETASGRKRLPSTPIFWFAWVDFFPGAPLWRPG